MVQQDIRYSEDINNLDENSSDKAPLTSPEYYWNSLVRDNTEEKEIVLKLPSLQAQEFKKNVLTQYAQSANSKNGNKEVNVKAKSSFKQYVEVLDNYLNTKVKDNYDLDSTYWWKAVNSGYTKSSLIIRKRTYSLTKLSTLLELSPTLPQCVSAMIRNVVGTGVKVTFKRNSQNKKNERFKFFSDIVQNANPEESLHQVIESMYEDYLRYGEAFLKVRYNRDRKGVYKFLDVYHIPSVQMSILKNEIIATSKKELKRGDDSFVMPYTKNYKVYLHAKPIHASNTNTPSTIVQADVSYYAEIGCPYDIDPQQGVPLLKAKQSEVIERIIHYKEYNDNSSYGKPRWVSKLGAIMGQIEAEAFNLESLSQNLIPKLVVLLKDAHPHNGDVKHFRELLTSKRGGGINSKASKAVFIRCASDNSNGAITALMKGDVPKAERNSNIQFVPLNDSTSKEMMFGNQIERWANDIMSCFSIPPIVLGLSSDYTRATASESLRMVEEQVFKIERRKLEYLINNIIIGYYDKESIEDLNQISFQSVSIAGLSDLVEVVKGMLPLNCISPNDGVDIYNKVMDGDKNYFEDGDIPIVVSFNNYQTDPSNASKDLKNGLDIKSTYNTKVSDNPLAVNKPDVAP